MSKGGIGVLLLIVLSLAGGIFFTVQSTKKSLPGDFLYRFKGISEQLWLATAELSSVEKAIIHINLTNRRLDELEKLENKRASSDILVGVLETVWKNEQLAVLELKRAVSKGENISKVQLEVENLNTRQQVIFNRLSEKIPSPGFYRILEISKQAKKEIESLSPN